MNKSFSFNFKTPTIRLKPFTNNKSNFCGHSRFLYLNNYLQRKKTPQPSISTLFYHNLTLTLNHVDKDIFINMVERKRNKTYFGALSSVCKRFRAFSREAGANTSPRFSSLIKFREQTSSFLVRCSASESYHSQPVSIDYTHFIDDWEAANTNDFDERDSQFRNLAPNTLNERFTVAEPNTVWCCDICKLKTKIINKPKKQLELFLALDLGTGKVVSYCVKTNIDAYDVVATLSPALHALKMNYIKLNRPLRLMIHSDRGNQFTSNHFTNMQRMFSSFLSLSMSRLQRPTDNSPVERLFRTIIRNKRFWTQLTPFKNEPVEIQTVEQYIPYINAIIGYYNHRWCSDRSLNLSPVHADMAFKAAYFKQMKPPPFFWAASNQHYLDEFKEIEEYRSMVAELFKSIFMDIAYTLNDEEANNLVRTQVYSQVRDEIFQEQLSSQSLKLEQISQNIENLKNLPKRKKKKVINPRIQTDPFEIEWASHLYDCFTFLKGNRLENTRNLVAILILAGTGIRCSDCHTLKHAQIKELIANRHFKIMNQKSNRYQEPVIIKSVLEILKQAYSDYCKYLDISQVLYSDDTYLNSSYGNLSSKSRYNLLHTRSFNRALNKSLDYFSKYLEKTFEKHNLRLKTHSGRYGLVSVLLKQNVPIAVVCEIMDHRSIVTTQKYNRNKVTPQNKKEIFDSLET
jgi:putative transposase